MGNTGVSKALVNSNINSGLSSGLLPSIYSKGFLTQIQRAIAYLRTLGANAHVWLPGIGALNGLQAGNYLDSAGTTLATVDNPVGLGLDALGVMGPELVTNGGFSGGTAGWTATPGTQISELSGSAWRIASADGSAASVAQVALTATIGKTYKISLEIISTTGGIVVDFGGATSPTLSTVGVKEFQLTCSSTVALVIKRSSICNTTFDNISVREITGIHATQATTANKPILRRGLLNLLKYSGDFSNAVWTKTNTTLSGALWSRATSAAANAFQAYTSAVGTTVTIAAKVKVATVGGRFALRLQGTYPDRADAVFDLTNGSLVDSTATTYTGASATISASGDYYVVALTATVTGTALARAAMGPTDSSLPTSGWEGASAVLSNAYVQSSGIFQGTLTAQQILAQGGIPLTTTAAASNPSAGSYSWQFDGSNDSLRLSSVPFQTQDNFVLIAGVAPPTLEVTVTRRIFQSSGSTALAEMYIGPSSGVLVGRVKDDAGTDTFTSKTGSLFGVTSVVSFSKSGDTKNVRVNGVPGSANTTATSTSTLTASTIGAMTGGTNTFLGNLYPTLAIKGTVPNDKLLLLEKLVAKLSGITL